MKIISERAYNGLVFKKTGSGRNGSPQSREVVNVVGNLSIGESVLITKGEWHLKSDVNAFVSHYSSEGNRLSGRKFSVRTLADGSGVVVRRTQ